MVPSPGFTSPTSSATRAVVGLAAALVVDGFGHPVAAAVARSARLATFATPEAFAVRLGLDEFTVRRCEAGWVPFARLPAAYLAHLDEAQPGLDLVSLRQLAGAVDVERQEVDRYGEVHAVDFGGGGAASPGPGVGRVC